MFFNLFAPPPPPHSDDIMILLAVGFGALMETLSHCMYRTIEKLVHLHSHSSVCPFACLFISQHLSKVPLQAPPVVVANDNNHPSPLVHSVQETLQQLIAPYDNNYHPYVPLFGHKVKKSRCEPLSDSHGANSSTIES